jgi:hypothetical protein
MSSPTVYPPTSLNAPLFPPISPPPPARPNTAPHCNKLVHHMLSPHIVTPLNCNAWAHFLTDDPDKEFVSSLLQIIKFGANIRFLGDQAARPQKTLNQLFSPCRLFSHLLTNYWPVTMLMALSFSPHLINFTAHPWV